MFDDYDYISSGDEFGLSDDNDYEDFKERIKKAKQEALLSNENEEESKKKHHQTIISAIRYGRNDTVFEELDKGLCVDVDLDLGMTPLLMASTVPNEIIFRAFLERGANIEHTSSDNLTPLMVLCSITKDHEGIEEKITNCVKLLIEKKVNVNICDKKRRTPIMLAAANGHLETVKLLLPLVDKEVKDGQKWTALFWAIEGNQPKIVSLLLDEGFTYDKPDLRGNTPIDLARNNEFLEIVDLFPKDPFDDFYSYLTKSDMYFEDIFKCLANNEKPTFFKDVCKILYGSRSEDLLPAMMNTSLLELLTMNNAKIEELGVKFPYQRNRLLGGIYQFHKYPFKPQSIPYIKRDQLYSNIDVATAIMTCIKQMIVMEAGLKFMLENDPKKLSLPEIKEVNIVIAKTREQIKRIQQVVGKLEKRIIQWDSKLVPVDLITKKRKNIFPWRSLCFAASIGSFLIWLLK